MKSNHKRLLAAVLAASVTAAVFCSCGDEAKQKKPDKNREPIVTVNAVPEAEDLGLSDLASLAESVDLGMSITGSLKKAYKTVGDTNPISSNIFFADPTAVEYNGRLYVYGTCDQQEFRRNGEKGSNTYGGINTISCFSTDDMKNWTYHGDIRSTIVCSWAGCSWAPSIVSRPTESGETEFFLYFCNSAGGVGVMKSNSPLGPWTDPIGRPLVAPDTAELKDDPVFWCFDPGVCIDDDGVGWLAFGGGEPMHSGESGLYTGNSRIVKLGSDMVSLDSKIMQVKVPYHFEANELNYINGKYVLTYCSNWAERNEWPSIYDEDTRPENCTMCYAVTDDPLDTDSWEYKGEYLKNPTSFGYPFSNNHSHLQKFGDKYYLFYQNVLLLRNMWIDGADGYRSIGVNEVKVDEKKAEFELCDMNDRGADAIKNFDPFKTSQGETANVCAGIEYKKTDSRIAAVASEGSWIAISGADFKDGANLFAATVSGKGIVEIRLDSKNGEAVGAIQFDSADGFNTYYCKLSEKISGVHDLYLVFGTEGSLILDKWQFASAE